MITNTVTAIQQLSTGINVAYPFPNKIFAASDLAITAIDLAGTAHPFTFLSGSTFTGPVTASVTNIDVDTGCTVTLSAPLAANWILDIRTNTAELQQTSIKNQGQFLPDLHEEAFDRLTREVQDLKRLTYTFGLHGTDTDIVPWGSLPSAAVRANQTLGFDATGQPIVFTEGEAGGGAGTGIAVSDGTTIVPLVETLNFVGATVSASAANAATVKFVSGYPVTPTETAAGVVPANLAFAPYDLRRYGGVGDGATDNTAALNNAIAVCVLAQATLSIPCGVFVHGRLAAITGNLSIVGIDSKTCILQLNTAAWPYAGANSNPVWSSAFDFFVTNVCFDQQWINATYGVPAGYNDGATANSWGGYFLGALASGYVRFVGCRFLNISRGFQIDNSPSVIFEGNQSRSELTLSESILGMTNVSRVLITGNSLIAALWTVNSGALYGMTATYCYNCNDVNISGNNFCGYQLHGTGVGTSSQRIIIANNNIDTPIADTGFTNVFSLVICGNTITNSGDMGIAVDNCQLVSITGNVIRGTHVGGINVGGCTNAVVANNAIWDIAQDYPIINAVANRWASTGGAWLSGISASFQAPDTGGSEICISGNTMNFSAFPPVSDIHGPVRASVLGIYLPESTNPAVKISASVVGNFVHADYANLPSFYIRVSSQYFYLNPTGAGAVISGELCSNGANSFIYNANFGPNGLCWVKKVIGTIPASTTFTGARSGASVNSSATPLTTWLNVVMTGNYDWTTTYNPN